MLLVDEHVSRPDTVLNCGDGECGGVLDEFGRLLEAVVGVLNHRADVGPVLEVLFIVPHDGKGGKVGRGRVEGTVEEVDEGRGKGVSLLGWRLVDERSWTLEKPPSVDSAVEQLRLSRIAFEPSKRKRAKGGNAREFPR